MSVKENIKIIPAKKKHRFEIKSINEQCLPENYDMHIWEYFLEFHTSYILSSNGTTVGYCLCGEAENDPFIASIISFSILPQFRGRKLGEKMLTKTIDNLRSKYRSVQLQVRVSNIPAISLYEKCGFEITHTLEKYYDDGENAYEMVKRLKRVYKL